MDGLGPWNSVEAMGRSATVLLCLCLLAVVAEEDVETQEEPPTKGASGSTNLGEMGEKMVSEQIAAMLEHFQKEDPKGLPGKPILDPMPIPDMRKSFSVGTMKFEKSSVYGLSEFRFEHIKTDLYKMQMSVGVSMELLTVAGNYTMSSFWTRAMGPFTITLTDVYAEGIATLEVQRDGKLRAEDITMDITFRNMDMDFQGLGFLASMFQGILNSVGTFVFDSVKPFIFREVNKKLRTDINQQAAKLSQSFPNSISPFDAEMANLREHVRKENWDPYLVADYTWAAGGDTLQVTLSRVVVTGLSTFYRVGSVSVVMERYVESAMKPVKIRYNNDTGEEEYEVRIFQRRVFPRDPQWRHEKNVTFIWEQNVLTAHAHVGTRRLTGTCLWEVNIGGIVSRSGTASFSAEYLQVVANVSQPMDTRKRPTLDDLKLYLGNIQARMSGTGTFDYVVELVTNILPNLLRQQILDAVDGRLREAIQLELDRMDVEEMIHRYLPNIDEAAKKLP